MAVTQKNLQCQLPPTNPGRFISNLQNGATRFFHFIAAIDEDIIKDCHKADKNWVSHIGFMLCLTFFVLFIITYLSFDYISATSVSIDDATNEIIIGEVNRNWQTVLFGMVLALIIALIVTLTDRAIYQSDWFYHKDYIVDGDTDRFPTLAVALLAYLLIAILLFFSDALRINFLNLLESTFNPSAPDFLFNTVIVVSIVLLPLVIILGISSCFNRPAESGMPSVAFGDKIWRIGIRLLISICVAIALSTFLELRIFESSIIEILKKEHTNENKVLYENYTKQVNALDENIKKLQDDKNNAQDRLIKLQKGIRIDEDTPEILKDLADENKRLDEELGKQISPIQKDLTELQKRQRELKQQRDEYLRKAQAEISGNPENMPDITSIPGCGQRCKYYQEQAEIVKNSIIENEAEINRIRTEIEEIRADISSQRRQLQVDYGSRGNISLSQTKTEQRQSLIEEARSAFEGANTRLKEAQENKPKQRERLQKELQENPDYRSFQAGPIARLRAFSIMKEDEKHGQTNLIFSLWVKAFVIFLEVIPVIVKMFFSPPSIYGMKLRYAVYKQTLAERRAATVDSLVTSGYSNL